MGDWIYATTTPGEQCVVIRLVLLMLEWPAEDWDLLLLVPKPSHQALAVGRSPSGYGSMKFGVLATSLPLILVDMANMGLIHACIVKISELDAYQVCDTATYMLFMRVEAVKNLVAKGF